MAITALTTYVLQDFIHFSSSQLRHTNQSKQEMSSHLKKKRKKKEEDDIRIIRRTTNELRHPPLRKIH